MNALQRRVKQLEARMTTGNPLALLSDAELDARIDCLFRKAGCRAERQREEFTKQLQDERRRGLL